MKKQHGLVKLEDVFSSWSTAVGGLPQNEGSHLLSRCVLTSEFIHQQLGTGLDLLHSSSGPVYDLEDTQRVRLLFLGRFKWD